MKQIISMILCIWVVFSSVASESRQREVKSNDISSLNIFSVEIMSGEDKSHADISFNDTSEELLQGAEVYDFSDEPYEAFTPEEENNCEAASSTYEAVFDSIEIYSEYAFVYDMNNEKIYSKGSLDETIYPASITKLWTAYIALEILEPEVVITAGDELDFVELDSSVAFIEKGNKFTVETLIEAMLLPSGNDAAYILARAAGEKLINDGNLSPKACIDAFIKAMNDYAYGKGMLKTSFMNPDGYHNDNHYTTMYDLLLMSKIVIECETILKYTGLSNDSVYFESGQYREWHNTNLLVNPTSQFYIEGVFGLKTGYTSLAGHCLLTAHKSRDNCIIVGVFRCDTSEHRFEDANKIINYKN